MTISWFGLSSFKITGKDVTVITDPFTGEVGLSPVRGGADIVVSSNPGSKWSNNFSSITGGPFIISGPGEYDIKGVFIMGCLAEGNNKEPVAIYSIELEDIRIAFLGLIKQTELNDTQKEVLEGADIVLVPVGGKEVLESDNAAKIATKLEPYIIIPHTYKTQGLNINLEKADKFLKEMGAKPEEMDKLTLKKKDLSAEATSVVVLTPQR